jgi:hypothetical protein
LSHGGYRTLLADGNLLAFERFAIVENKRESLVLLVNRSDCSQNIPPLPLPKEPGTPLLGEPLKPFGVLPPFGCSLTRFSQALETEDKRDPK